MPKPIEIKRIFGHLDRDPMAVAEVIARMPPEDAAQLLMDQKRWTVAVADAYRARVESGGEG
jgi:hypothetical protein